MIVTIDGPAGAGKSSAARELAQRLGFQFLDTGAMYRAMAWAILNRGVDPEDHQAVLAALPDIKIDMSDDQVLVDGRNVTQKLRSAEVSQHASIVAAIPEVREVLVKLQRTIAATGDFVCEGRDQGTVAFPDAECKLFLTAAPEVRAQRRWQEMQASDPNVQLDNVIAEQKIRDLRDETRLTGRLVKADDAIEVRVDNLSLDEVARRLEQLARQKLAASATGQASGSG
ncbi:MAG: (d)CMP kinase [Pirellulaceae bacterium]